jgi:cytochrome bd ubiquinol oxidase subunit II
MSFDQSLPIIFMCLMGFAMLVYVMLDGYDLGVGMLLPLVPREQKNVMVASIGPFWDANETWLVLGVGILIIAFPKAQGVVLTALYLPTATMLIGLMLRGVAFDFRVKARTDHHALWDVMFFVGSSLASIAQGWMLGRFITGFAVGVQYQLFALIISIALPMAYVLLGAGWLIMKTESELQEKAVLWAKAAWLPVVVGIALISLATPWVSGSVREKWFSLPALFALIPIPIATAVALLFIPITLKSTRARTDLCWIPFSLTLLVMLLGFFGLAYSLYPYIVMDKLDLWQAAAAPKSLRFILIGTVITVPTIVFYTVFVYRIFHGKAEPLHYA